MSDSRSRPTRRSQSGAGGGTVGGKQGGGIPIYFIGAVVAVVVAFVILITVAADAFGGDDGGGVASPDVTPSEAATSDATTGAGETQAPTRAPEATATPTPDRDGKVQVTCGDVLAPVDKQHRLAANCVPSDLQQLPAEYASGYQSMRSEAAGAIQEFLGAGKQAGYALYVNSSFRSFQDQEYTYNYWVAQNGQEYADRTSARPGHSEHQMGTTADIGWNGCELECTEGTPEAAWIAANAHLYGFIVSYPEGKEQITGYAYEPWHVRYVGKDVAAQVHASGLTLHEFLLK